MKKFFLLCLLLTTCLSGNLSAQDMTLEKLKSYISKDARLVDEQGNVAMYELDSVQIYLITDVASDRMRLIAGVVEEKDLKPDDYKLLMEVNYDRALDARYALSDGVLWSVFVHPLSDLTPYVIQSGLFQVRNLVYTYGSSYTSTSLVYGNAAEDGKDRKN